MVMLGLFLGVTRGMLLLAGAAEFAISMIALKLRDEK